MKSINVAQLLKLATERFSDDPELVEVTMHEGKLLMYSTDYPDEGASTVLTSGVEADVWVVVRDIEEPVPTSVFVSVEEATEDLGDAVGVVRGARYIDHDEGDDEDPTPPNDTR